MIMTGEFRVRLPATNVHQRPCPKPFFQRAAHLLRLQVAIASVRSYKIHPSHHATISEFQSIDCHLLKGQAHQHAPSLGLQGMLASQPKHWLIDMARRLSTAQISHKMDSIAKLKSVPTGNSKGFWNLN